METGYVYEIENGDETIYVAVTGYQSERIPMDYSYTVSEEYVYEIDIEQVNKDGELVGPLCLSCDGEIEVAEMLQADLNGGY